MQATAAPPQTADIGPAPTPKIVTSSKRNHPLVYRPTASVVYETLKEEILSQTLTLDLLIYYHFAESSL